MSAQIVWSISSKQVYQRITLGRASTDKPTRRPNATDKIPHVIKRIHMMLSRLDDMQLASNTAIPITTSPSFGVQNFDCIFSAISLTNTPPFEHPSFDIP